jgi:hypothetical protein
MGTQVKAFKDDAEGDGPEIIILDPNDPEGAYEQMMDQYLKNQDGSEGHRSRSGRHAGHRP